MDSKDEATIKLWVAAVIANRDTDAAAVIAERIARLEAKLTTLQQLEEQHLAHIDKQAERIAVLEAEIEAKDNYIDDLEDDIAELT